FLLRVPAQSTAQPEREVGQVTDGGHPVRAFQVGQRLLARLDAIKEVADVAFELLLRIARSVLDGRGPELLWARAVHPFRPADGVGAGEPGHGVFRWDFAVAGQDEAFSVDRQAAPRATELQAHLALAVTRFPVRPHGRATGVLDEGVLGVGR